MGKTFAILGATGQIGRKVVKNLLSKGHRVKAIGRNAQKLADLKSQGAEVFASPYTEGNALTLAFKGADAVFTFLPPCYFEQDFVAYQNEVGKATVEAIEANGIRHAVNLSGIGAHLTHAPGPLQGLHDQEERLNAIKGLNALHLRPAYFMENLLWLIVKQPDFIASPIRGDLPIAMVSVEDIGSKAAALLEGLSFHGHSAIEYLGPRFITFDELAELIGKLRGHKDFSYRQIPYDVARNASLAAGIPASATDILIDMYRGFNENRLDASLPVKDENKGSLTIEAFIAKYADAFK